MCTVLWTTQQDYMETLKINVDSIRHKRKKQPEMAKQCNTKLLDILKLKVNPESGNKHRFMLQAFNEKVPKKKSWKKNK